MNLKYHIIYMVKKIYSGGAETDDWITSNWFMFIMFIIIAGLIALAVIDIIKNGIPSQQNNHLL